MKNSRLEYVDFYRGIGIILMIMGHIGFGQVFDKYIHAFHMPMFFFVSGFFYDKEKYKIVDLIKKRIISLLIPYVAFAVIHYILYFCLYGFDAKLLLSIVWNSPDPTIPIAGALWFLTALFFTELLYAFLDIIIAKQIFMDLTIIALVIIGMLFGNIVPYRLPFSLDISMVCMGYYHIAKRLKDRRVQSRIDLYNVKPYISIPAFLLVSTIVFVNGSVNVRLVTYSNPFLFLFNSVLLSLIGWNLCRSIFPILEKCKVARTIDRQIVHIGKNSITYLCLNQLLIFLLRKFMAMIGFKSVIFNIITLFVVLFGLFILNIVFSKTRLCILIGKRR